MLAFHRYGLSCHYSLPLPQCQAYTPIIYLLNLAGPHPPPPPPPPLLPLDMNPSLLQYPPALILHYIKHMHMSPNKLAV